MIRVLSVVLVCSYVACIPAGCRAADSNSRAEIVEAFSPSSPALEIGSTRNARIAIDTNRGQHQLVYLAGQMDAEMRSNAERLAPNIRFIVGASREEAMALAPGVHGIDGRYCTPEFLASAKQLVWVQSTSAGVERYLDLPLLVANNDIVLTNMRGVHGATIADHAFAMLLSLTRDIAHYADSTHRGTWSRAGSGRERIALRGRTLLVIGLGGIGSEVAKRGQGFGMRVLATRRSAESPPPYVDRQGDPEDLLNFLREADVVVLCVPLTAETQGMISRDSLAAMKRGSYIINVARGRVIDTEALVEALQSGHLAGACLDVTDPEPLPAGHVLWTMSNVIITPHMSADSELTSTQWSSVYLENLRRFGAGEPLLNVVDKVAGY